MKRTLPLAIVFVAGMIMVIQHFIPSQQSEFVYEYANDWVICVGIYAIMLGIWSLVRVTVEKARRDPDERVYSIVTLVAMAVMIIAGLKSESLQTGSFFMKIFQYVLIPIQATIFSLLAFYIASAAYRAFRARSALATLLLLTAFIVMLRMIPLGPISSVNQTVVGWILSVPNLAAKRAIIMGVGLGAIAMSMKIILGIERSYLGRD
ncbi:MAG: hypothetical protein CO189_11930 [candidate division Zixibacteria bacterium CG_4_9_14_3_um_filter_46_8]|nr:MAG: hypothetical protein CO189_11930 [candidate division Zixibacteria bacterium CG_4_9_14_3_um_filter_46_8]